MKYRGQGYLLLLLTLLSLLVGCSSTTGATGNANNGGTQSACDKAATIKGNVASIFHAPSGAAANFVGGILIDGSREPHAAYDKVYASLHTDTQVYEKQGQSCRTVSFAVLQVGQRVQVQSATGAVLQTYPPQIDVNEIVILSQKA